MAVVGIDLGTTNSIVSAFVDGKSILIPNSNGELLTPSVVSLTGNGEIIVGNAAKDRLISSPDLTASLFKRQMGNTIQIKLGRKTFQPEELSSFILRRLIKDAEIFLGEPVTELLTSAQFPVTICLAARTLTMLLFQIYAPYMTLTYDINAMLVVQAKAVSTGKEYQLVIAGKGLSIPDHQLEKYVKNIHKTKLAHYERMDLLPYS